MLSQEQREQLQQYRETLRAKELSELQQMVASANLQNEIGVDRQDVKQVHVFVLMQAERKRLRELNQQ
jgi:hypothetical protein|uniref:Uncharacterized protein n=1 Tax=viral metagenome TaxID=1070528 RepID=A0A6C0IX51_9ZZZZ